MAIRQPASELELLLLTMADDTEDAPWMVMNDWQWHAVDVFMSVLNLHVARQSLPWYTASYMKITMWRPDGRPLDLVPDAFVADGERRMRDSWNVAQEGAPPRFVLEVMTRQSRRRDTVEKVGAYQEMGVAEYALFAPERRSGGPRLFGYRRDAAGTLVTWPADADGALVSDALGGLRLYLEPPHGLRLCDQEGRRLPSEAEEAAAHLAALRRAQTAEERASAAEAARQAAEAEAARLREELRRLREGDR